MSPFEKLHTAYDGVGCRGAALQSAMVTVVTFRSVLDKLERLATSVENSIVNNRNNYYSLTRVRQGVSTYP